MFSDLQTILRLDGSEISGKFVHLVEEDDNLANFLVHHFVNLGLKQGKKVVIVGLENTFGHYNAVGLKLGNNLMKLKESKSVFYYDFMSKFSTFCDNPKDLVQDLLETLDSELTENSILVLDKFSLVSSLGFTAKQSLNLAQKLQKLVVLKKSTLVTCSRANSNLGSEDYLSQNEQNEVISAFLSHSATLNIVVRPLKSGKSRNVTGNLTFLWTLPNQGNKPQEYQFRVEEKDVKIFSAGTSNAVL